MKIPSSVKKHEGWILLGISLATFALGIYLSGHFLCKSIGPSVLLVAIGIGALSCISLLVRAFQRRSILSLLPPLLVGLLMTILAFASVGLTLPGCGGV